jgi:hypothetical protein
VGTREKESLVQGRMGTSWVWRGTVGILCGTT